jgi:sterol desaturase/sphingolipid hydroxylase (fatty acid hydroxylase superfamily)
VQTLILVGSVGVLMMACEALAPGRRWPAVRGWWPRALAVNAVQVASVLLGGLTWDAYLRRHRLWSAEALGPAWGVLIGYLAITFVYYWWHRWRHASPFLWRWLHQLHHSPQRIEIVTSFYKHPFEIVANGILSSAVLYVLVGLSPLAAATAVSITGLAELVYHWNVRTPHWLGYVFQRPESHCVHHQEGLHSCNYSDLPLWDVLFGTFRNPRRWDARCGLGAGREGRLLDLLRGVDVVAPANPGSRR